MAIVSSPQTAAGAPLPARLWQYQKERFPLLAHGVAMVAFTLAALSVSASFAEAGAWPGSATLGAALVGVFGFFLLLRIADEFKDAADDARYRAYRPVPRGLVSLRELAVVGGVAAAAQLVAALWLHPPLAGLLIAAWIYFGLMSAEFFAPAWLRRHPLVYMISHVAFVPLVALYATACHWLAAGLEPDAAALSGFLILAVGNGLVFETGRKIRSPGEEQTGVQTYSGLWGPGCAIAVWAASVMLAACGALITTRSMGSFGLIAAVSAVAVLSAFAIARTFAQRPTRTASRVIRFASQAIVLALLLAIGVPPILGQA